MRKIEMERLLRRIHNNSIMCPNENGYSVMVIENAADIDQMLYDMFGQPKTKNIKETKEND
jgi:hypothetical protein